MKYFLYKPTGHIYKEVDLRKVLSDTLTVDPTWWYLDIGREQYMPVHKTNPSIIEITFWEYWKRKLFF